MKIHERKKRKAEEYRQRTAAEVAVPACVADCTSTTVAVGEEMDLCGTEEFFAKVALEIDEMLKSAGKFGND